MKKISEKAAQAFKNGTSFELSNTRVFNFGNYTVLSLYGNWIAARNNNTGHIWSSSCGWPTATTRERLQAIGVNVRIHKGEFVNMDGTPFKDQNVFGRVTKRFCHK
mgnify:CR=1 FL=1